MQFAHGTIDINITNRMTLISSRAALMIQGFSEVTSQDTELLKTMESKQSYIHRVIHTTQLLTTWHFT